MRSHGMHDLDSVHGDEEQEPFVDQYARIEWEDDEFISKLQEAIYVNHDKPKSGE